MQFGARRLASAGSGSLGAAGFGCLHLPLSICLGIFAQVSFRERVFQNAETIEIARFSVSTRSVELSGAPTELAKNLFGASDISSICGTIFSNVVVSNGPDPVAFLPPG